MAHIHEKIDFTVEVFIVHDNRVLLRKHDKLGIWLSVGGHIELTEDPCEAALREVREEVGLEVTLWDSRAADYSDEYFRELIPPVFMGRMHFAHSGSKEHEHVTFVYFARSVSTDVNVGHDGDRSDEWRWFAREELDAVDLRHNIKNYAIHALETLTS